MDRYKAWFAGSIVIMVVIMGLGWFLGVSPQLAARSAAEQSRDATESKNVEYEATLTALRVDDSRRSEYESALEELAKSVPFDTDYARFIGHVDAAAAKRGVTVISVVAGEPQSYVPPAPGAASDEPATTPDSGAGAGAGDAATTPAPTPSSPGSVAAAPMPVTSPLVTSENFVVVPVEISTSGTFDAVMHFVEDMQLGPRLFLVNAVSTAPLTVGAPGEPAAASQVTGTIGGFIYTLAPKTK